MEEAAVAATRLTIARLAGVSVATVDRVLRSDSAVRPETAERVRLALDGLRVARASRGRPAKATSFRVALVLPQIPSHFLDQVERDIALSASFFREHRITPSFYRSDFSSQHDTAAFADTVRGYDAAILVPLDYPWVERLIEETADAGVPVVTIFSDLPASRRALYLGVDDRTVGRTAGLLLGRFSAGRIGTVILLSGSSRLHDQVERRTGFAQILEEDFRNLRWVVESDFPEDDDSARLVALGLFAQHPDLIGIYATGGGTPGIARALDEAAPTEKPVFVSHGLTAQTRALLAEQVIDVVLDQDVRGIVHSAGLAALNLINDVRGSLPLPKPTVQIYFRENAHS
jgi:LacI family transcriptional regulator